MLRNNAKDKTKKSKYILSVGAFVFTQPLICECSAGALLEHCQRLLAVVHVWLRVSSVYVCLVFVHVSSCCRHSCVASAPRHTPDAVLLFPRSSSDLSTFLSPSHTSMRTHTHTQHSTESMFFPSSWTALSPCSVSLCRPPLSRIPVFLSLLLWLRPRGSLLVGN